MPIPRLAVALEEVALAGTSPPLATDAPTVQRHFITVLLLQTPHELASRLPTGSIDKPSTPDYYSGQLLSHRRKVCMMFDWSTHAPHIQTLFAPWKSGDGYPAQSISAADEAILQVEKYLYNVVALADVPPVPPLQCLTT